MSFDQELIDTFTSKTGLFFTVPQTDYGFSLIHRDVEIYVHIIDDVQVIKGAYGENHALIMKVVDELLKSVSPYNYSTNWEIADDFRIV